MARAKSQTVPTHDNFRSPDGAPARDVREIVHEKNSRSVRTSPDPLQKSDRYRFVIPYSGSTRDLGNVTPAPESIATSEGVI